MSRVEDLRQEIEQVNAQIARLFERAQSAGSYGNRRFTNLNATLLRGKAAALQVRKEEAIKELGEMGIEYARSVHLPATVVAAKRYHFYVVPAEGGWDVRGDYGCRHEIGSSDGFDAAKQAAIAAHIGNCLRVTSV